MLQEFRVVVEVPEGARNFASYEEYVQAMGGVGADMLGALLKVLRHAMVAPVFTYDVSSEFGTHVS